MENLRNVQFAFLLVKKLGKPTRYPKTHSTRSGQIKQWNWICQCVCGKRLSIQASNLKRPNASCGCYRKKMCGDLFRTHGESRSPEHEAWLGIKKRCKDKNCTDYVNYGGRGITVCARWLNSYENFLADVGRRPSPKHTLDRKNNNGNYTPGNCRWSTRKEQCRNKRNNRVIKYRGEKLCLSAWAEKTGLKAVTIAKRLSKGWSVKRALTAPLVVGRPTK